MSNQIVIKLRPMPATRPRVTKNGTYNTPKYESYKQIIQLHCRSFKKLEGKLKVELGFCYKTPKRPTTDIPVGDVDNLAKSILDALEGVAFYNDRQVVDLHIKKQYAEDDGIFIGIENVVQ